MKKILILPEQYYDGQNICVAYAGRKVKILLRLFPQRILLTFYSCNEEVCLKCELNPASPVIFTESFIHGSMANEYGKQKIREMIEDYFKKNNHICEHQLF